MEKRIKRVKRIYDITNLMWSIQLRRIAILDTESKALNKAELQTIHHFNQSIPAELTASRLRQLYLNRLQLEEKKSIETIKAKALGLKLKRIENLFTKINEQK